jgi:hypothetical protein
MSKKRYRPEEIIGKLREADIRISAGAKNTSGGRCIARRGNCAEWTIRK